jgi:hypothetical protein
MHHPDSWHPTGSTPLGDCREGSCRVMCGGCDRASTFRLTDAAGTYGRAVTVGRLVARLRCRQCRRQPVEVQLVSTIDPHAPGTAIRVPIG